MQNGNDQRYGIALQVASLRSRTEQCDPGSLVAADGDLGEVCTDTDTTCSDACTLRHLQTPTTDPTHETIDATVSPGTTPPA